MERRANNRDIREALQRHGMFQWQLADRMGVTEATLCRWLRHEITDERKGMILAAIESQE